MSKVFIGNIAHMVNFYRNSRNSIYYCVQDGIGIFVVLSNR
jgi:hypothetical protein